VGEDVTFTVRSRGSGDPVGGVDLYAIGPPLKGFLPAPSGAMDADSSTLETLVRENGFFIGTTNERGEYVHAFDEAGGFVIVGIKAGYSPALGFVRVGDWSGLGQFLPSREGAGGETRRSGPAMEDRRFGGMGVLDKLAPRLQGPQAGLRGLPWRQD
jgi:hypothetical protein